MALVTVPESVTVGPIESVVHAVADQAVSDHEPRLQVGGPTAAIR